MQFIREERLQQLHSLTKLYRADFTFCSTPHKTFWRNSLHGPRENSTSLYGPDKMKLPCIAFVLFSIPCMTFPSPSVRKFCQHQTELSPAVRPLCFAANATENASHPRGSRLRRRRPLCRRHCRRRPLRRAAPL